MAPVSPILPSHNDLGANAWSAAFTFAVAVALFTLAGVWLDRQLGTGFLFLIAGFLLGSVGGFLHLLARLAPGTLGGARSRRASVPAGVVAANAATPTKPSSRLDSDAQVLGGRAGGDQPLAGDRRDREATP